MKTILSFTLFILFLLIACSNTESTNEQQSESAVNYTSTEAQKNNTANTATETLAQNKSCCVPDSNIFSLKHINKTLNHEDNLVFGNLKNLNQKQVDAWLKPFTERFDYYKSVDVKAEYCKAISFQKKTEQYFSLLLMITFADASIEQLLVNIGNSGKFIDGLQVAYQRNLSNWDAELDSARGIYIMTTDRRTKFSGDTIIIYELQNVSPKGVNEPHTDKDVWDELYETIYLIQPDGKIAEIRGRKKITERRDE